MDGQGFEMAGNNCQHGPQLPICAPNQPISYPMTPNPSGQDMAYQSYHMPANCVPYAPQAQVPVNEAPLTPSRTPHPTGEHLDPIMIPTLQANYVAFQYTEGHPMNVLMYQLPPLYQNQPGAWVVDVGDYLTLYEKTHQRKAEFKGRSRFEVLQVLAEERGRLVQRLAHAEKELAARDSELQKAKQTLKGEFERIDFLLEEKYERAKVALKKEKAAFQEEHRTRIDGLVEEIAQLKAREQERLNAINAARARDAQAKKDNDLKTRKRESPPSHLNHEQRQLFLQNQTSQLHLGGPQYSWLTTQPAAPKEITPYNPIDGAAPCKGNKSSKKRPAADTDEIEEVSKPAKKPRTSPAAVTIPTVPKTKVPRKATKACKPRDTKSRDAIPVELEVAQPEMVERSDPAAPKTKAPRKATEACKPRETESCDDIPVEIEVVQPEMVASNDLAAPNTIPAAPETKAPQKATEACEPHETKSRDTTSVEIEVVEPEMVVQNDLAVPNPAPTEPTKLDDDDELDDLFEDSLEEEPAEESQEDPVTATCDNPVDPPKSDEDEFDDVLGEALEEKRLEESRQSGQTEQTFTAEEQALLAFCQQQIQAEYGNVRQHEVVDQDDDDDDNDDDEEEDENPEVCQEPVYEHNYFNRTHREDSESESEEE